MIRFVAFLLLTVLPKFAQAQEIPAPTPEPVVAPTVAPTPVPTVQSSLCEAVKLVYRAVPNATNVVVSVELDNAGMAKVVDGKDGWKQAVQVDTATKVTTVTATNGCLQVGLLQFSAHFDGVAEANFDCMGVGLITHGSWEVYVADARRAHSYVPNGLNGCEAQRDG